jgi:hypothetical protein
MNRVVIVSLCAVTVLCVGVPSGVALDVQVTAVEASLEGPSDRQLLQLRPRLRRLVGYARGAPAPRSPFRAAVWSRSSRRACVPTRS